MTLLKPQKTTIISTVQFSELEFGDANKEIVYFAEKLINDGYHVYYRDDRSEKFLLFTDSEQLRYVHVEADRPFTNNLAYSIRLSPAYNRTSTTGFPVNNDSSVCYEPEKVASVLAQAKLPGEGRPDYVIWNGNYDFADNYIEIVKSGKHYQSVRMDN